MSRHVRAVDQPQGSAERADFLCRHLAELQAKLFVGSAEKLIRSKAGMTQGFEAIYVREVEAEGFVGVENGGVVPVHAVRT